jgi:aspartate 1-decarboxylase
MQSILLKSKIHHARVTLSDRDYEGSLLIDEDLMAEAKIVPYEKILVADVENGNRFETYAIPGEAGSGVIGVNGATTHLADIGDRVIIFTFCELDEDELSSHKPVIVVVDADNKPKTV